VEFEDSPGGLSGEFFIGNPFTDVPDLCSNVFLVADGDPTAACELGRRMALELWDARAIMQQALLGAGRGRKDRDEVDGPGGAGGDAADATNSGA
jgi:microcystin degradation protein MlrC